jgi:serine/threonine-protein kinase
VSEPETAAPAAAERLGTVIAERYQLREILGEGGMGTVYLAEHIHMKKRVALKLLHPEMVDNAEVARRFEREALASAHLEHPNIAAATDFGKTEDGAFFLVLEYVEGVSLRDALTQPISVARSLRIARQIALALERAHEAGVVHRDLKPENVMLATRDGEPDLVKVLDFGVAKLLEGALSASEAIAQRSGGGSAAPLTRIGTILGTPEYMAPEQALGEAVTPAADLYAVGVILYEMLTGKHPFDPPDRMAMLSFHIVAPVPAMEDRAPERSIPASVEALTRSLLEKEAKTRPSRARALVDAIDAAGRATGLEIVGAPSAAASPSSATARGDDAPARGDDAPSPSEATLPFAQTSAGMAPASEAARGAAPRGGGSIPALSRNALLAIAGAATLAVIGLGALGLRGPRPSPPQSALTSQEADAAPRAAPSERVSAAIALGPSALEALTEEFPDDPWVRQKLAVAYGMAGKSNEAMRVARALLTADAGRAPDDELLQLVVATAGRPQGDADDAAFALLEGPLGERGVDGLLELTAKGSGKEARELRARAMKSLAKPEVRAHASSGALLLLDLKGASSCAGKRDLLARAKESGDARALPLLRALKPTTGCGFLSRRDCWPCLRNGALEDALAAIEARTPTP